MILEVDWTFHIKTFFSMILNKPNYFFEATF